MNPKLALPLVLSVAAFGIAFQQIQTRSSQPKGIDSNASYTMHSEEGVSEAMTETIAADVEGMEEFRPDPTGNRLMTATQARAWVATKMKKQDESYRRMSRVMVRRETEFVKVELHNQTLITDPYFLGSVTIKKQRDQRVAPIQIDRRTGKVNVFVQGKWTEFKFVDSSMIHQWTNPAERVDLSKVRLEELKLSN